MKITIYKIVVFVAALACGNIVGCGGEPADSRERFEAAKIRSECEQWLRCEHEDSDEDLYRASSSMAACIREGEAWVDPELEAFLDEGTMVYDPRAGKACLESYEALCIGGLGGVCNDVYVGTVPAGGSCVSSLQCESERCSGNALSCGECRARAEVGESCRFGEVCPENAFCDAVSLRCELSTDVEPRSYVQAVLGESCASTVSLEISCAPDLFCDDETERCTERRAAGLRCEQDECVAGTVCLYNETTEESRCAPVEITDVPGADCGELPNRYVVCDRAERLHCGNDQVCIRLGGDGQDGSDCLDDTDCTSERCVYGDDDTGLCVFGDRPNGSACANGEQCRSRYCSQSAGEGVCTNVPTCN